MNWSHLFLISNLVAAAAWLVLIVGIVRSRSHSDAARAIGAILAAVYLILFVLNASEASVLVKDYSVSGVQQFFAHPPLAVAGWVHYLVFDLWVGAWEVDNAPAAMPRPLLIASLVLTLAVGPIGLGFFLIARRKWL